MKYTESRAGQVLIEVLVSSIFLAMIIPHVPDLADAAEGGPEARAYLVVAGMDNVARLRRYEQHQQDEAAHARELKRRQIEAAAAVANEARESSERLADLKEKQRVAVNRQALIKECEKYRGWPGYQVPASCSTVMQDINAQGPPMPF